MVQFSIRALRDGLAAILKSPAARVHYAECPPDIDLDDWPTLIVQVARNALSRLFEKPWGERVYLGMRGFRINLARAQNMIKNVSVFWEESNLRKREAFYREQGSWKTPEQPDPQIEGFENDLYEWKIEGERVVRKGYNE